MLSQQPLNQPLRRWIGGADQRQRNRPQPQFEKAIAARGLQVIMAFGRGPADQLDLAAVKTERS
jgi:hypothetical protein